MALSVQLERASTESLATALLRNCTGDWKSERRYYTLKQETSKEVVSYLSIEFLDRGDDRLLHLAQLHNLPEDSPLVCGSLVTWDSHYIKTPGKPIQGSTLFGVRGEILYRDRGFATTKPLIAKLHFPNPQTMCLRTEYDGSVFEEDIKLIGTKYRTRQTIISRAGEEHTIGQYLETRC
jgi:CpeS-like protein